MGLLQRALETYEAMSAIIGQEEENKEPLAPIGFLITRARIEITLDQDGNFVQAAVVDNKIAIPVTEDSAGRTSAPAAHPLCDNLTYLLEADSKRHALYMEQLSEWVESQYTDPKLTAIYAYVKSGNLFSDLIKTDIIKTDENGKLKNDKDIVCWRIIGLGEKSGPVWTDTNLMAKYSSFYLEKRSDEKQQPCMLTGLCDIPAKQHLKGVVALNGNAKIISANDSSNFTYRGRFLDDEEALSIGYHASQKAHNALKWIVSNQGVIEGGRVFICWNPKGKIVPMPLSPILRFEDRAPEPTEYRDCLKKKITGYKKELPNIENVVIASFDAATTGRLAITYYNELLGSDFIDRLAYWDETCMWYDQRFGTSSPLLYDIISYAFGTLRGDKIDIDERIISQHMQRLLTCRIDQAAFPTDIMRSIVQKVGNLQIYSPFIRNKLLFTACAVIRKYRIDRYKEDWEMALEAQRADRSYQYGRLLAVMEKIERDTYDKDEKREPNAIRMQNVFIQRPGYATKVIIDQLKNAYYPRLSVSTRIFYDRLIGEIMEMISEFSIQDFNKPLTETYLLGYYLQKNALYTKKEQTNETEE